MQILDVYDAVMKYDGCDKIRPLNRYAMIQREKRKKKIKRVAVNERGKLEHAGDQ